MTKFALYVPLKAKPGKEKEVADFLRSAVPIGERRGGHDLVVRHPRGAVLVRHLRHVRRRGRSQRASQWEGSAGTHGKGKGRRSV